ncbi:S9 family peptidase [Fusobacterium sp.]|uniref:alpha/beta hydrolase family protein n=1 Tax=Fusobacterium sp. TaxID=68766 RepID=UPI0025C61F7B|nr:S9 family peptidase [Fusobacterium sp.]
MESLKIEDFLDYNYLSELNISPDGKYVSFLQHRANYDENNYSSNIYILNRDTEEYCKLTELSDKKQYMWIDKNSIVFSSNKDRELQLRSDEGESWSCYQIIDLESKKIEEFMRIPLEVTSIKNIDGENFILTAQYDNYGVELNGVVGDERIKKLEEIRESKNYEIIDEIPFWSNGKGFTNKKRNRLYMYNRLSGEIYPISDRISNVNYYSYRDGKIVYTVNRFTNKQEQREGIYSFDITTKSEDLLLASEEFRVNFVEFFNDGIICGLNDTKDYGLNQNPKFYTIKDGELKLFKENDSSLSNSVGSDCRYGNNRNFRENSGKLYYVTTISHSSVLKSLDEMGVEITLSSADGSVDGFILAEQEIYFIGMKGLRLQEIYSIKNGKERRVTGFNEKIYENKELSRPEKLSIVSNGVEIEGWVIKPTNYEEGKMYPAILDIHGGPKTVYGDIFYHEMQVWANLGYFVFFCNPHGGDGRGNEFADIRGKYGTIDYEDLMNFTDKVTNSYPIIERKIGVTGGSYGGYMTNWIIGHTNRFACAVSQRSISNWFSKFGTTDIGYYFNVDQNMSSPWKNPEKLWWHSPLKYANRVVTPTLFIHSEEDYRCWLAEGLQMFTALKYHGVKSRLCMFKGENHELSRSGKPKNRVKRLQEITKWFEEFLK